MDGAQFQQFLAQLRQNGGMPLDGFSSGDSVEWRDWRSHFTTIAAHKEWNDLTQRRQLKAAMRKEAAARVRDLEVEDHANIDAMLTAFEDRFVPQAEAMIVKAEFESARQSPQEKLMDWHGRLRAIFIRAYPNRNAANDDQLIRTFIAGIADPAIKMFVLEGAPDTYAAALTRAQNKEAMLLTVRQMGQLQLGHRRGAIHQIGGSEESEIDPASVNFVQGGEGKKGTCFFCQKPGHFAKDCYILKRAEIFLKRMRANGKNATSGQSNSNKKKDRRRGGRSRGNKPAVHNIGAEEEVLPPADENFQKALEDLPDSFFQELTE